uniref:Cadherin-1 n=1 Tax=Myripristis murdjan TaxID=586833 RepID=A0A667ZJ16_9TELE
MKVYTADMEVYCRGRSSGDRRGAETGEQCGHVTKTSQAGFRDVRHMNDAINTEKTTIQCYDHNQHIHISPYQLSRHTESDVRVLFFPKSSQYLRRRKRAWVIPPINFPENDRGPFPKFMVQIRSDEDKFKTIRYSITGPGADQDPVGLFHVDRDNGNLYVTQPLDREKQDEYRVGSVSAVNTIEEPMEIKVFVIDMNDNKPIFTKDTFLGDVPEASSVGFEITKVEATDLDEPGNANSDIRYKILSQDPQLPNGNMFEINPLSGVIRVNSKGLDREKCKKYTLEVQAADLEGIGLTGNAKVILSVTDSNDNAPTFSQSTYEATIPENKVGALVVKMPVNDGDEPNSPAWNAKFKIVSGDPDGYFTVETGPNKNEGIVKTAKGLDFERSRQHTLQIAVVNDVPFALLLPTSTGTVVVNVEDVNEAPIFKPVEMLVVKPEDQALGALVTYTATDPDFQRKQTVSYKLLSDLADWLTINKNTGVISLKSNLDRESHFVTDDKYTALIGAYDNDDVPATGTGTLIIKVEDVNDNAPSIEERSIKVCNKDTVPQHLSVTDKDGPGNTSPFSVALDGESQKNWTARMNTGIILTLARVLPQGEYTVVLNVRDAKNEQVSTLLATVCDCTGENVFCSRINPAGVPVPVIVGVLAAILLLLMLVLLLLLFLRRRGQEKMVPLLPEDEARDDLFHYDEEGGGEDDKDYDLSILHRGLDNRPQMFRDDVKPNYVQMPQYRPRPANPEDIGNFIHDNLKAADSDPTAPPYDSLLVFDHEGEGSDAGSLSSLNSSSSGDQDYDCLSEWGPRFKKLADMYGGGEDDML